MKNKIDNSKSNVNKKDVLLFFLTKTFSGILSFVSISIFTYLLNPSIYGEFSLIQGLINIFVSVFIGWMSSASLRYYDDFKIDKNKFYTNIFLDFLISNIFVILLIFTISLININVNIKDYLILSILLFITTSLIDLFNSIIRASKETNVYFVTVISQYIINIGIFLFLTLVLNMKIIAVFVSYIVAYGVISLFFIFHFKIYKYIRFKDYSIVIQKKILKYGLPMVGVWATNWILNYSDRYIIKMFFSSNEVGLYDVAYKLAENSINIIITSISMAMMPHIIDSFKKGGNDLSNLTLKNYLRIFNILVIPAIFGLIGIRYHIYGTIISKDYISGANIIIYICISMYFFGICQLLYKIWQVNEKTNNILKLMILSVIINIILNLIYIPKYGFIAASVTTLFSNIITFILTLISVKRDYKFKFDILNFLKSLISSGIMFIFIILFNKYVSNIFMILVEIVFSIFIYLFILYVLKGLEPEKAILKKFFSRNK